MGISELNLFVAIVTLIVASASVVIGLFCFKYQYVSLILSQSLAKANECNDWLPKDFYLVSFNDKTLISNILTSSIVAIQLIDFHLEEYKFLRFFYDREKFIQQLFLMLHTSIRLFYKKDLESRFFDFDNMQATPKDKATMKKQFSDCQKNFEKAILKYS